MILKKKNSKKFFFNSNIISKLLYVYFFLSVSVGILFLIFFFTSYKFKAKTEELFEYLSKAGRIEYINLPKISWMAFKSNFYSLPQVDIELGFDEILKFLLCLILFISLFIESIPLFGELSLPSKIQCIKTSFFSSSKISKSEKR